MANVDESPAVAVEAAQAHAPVDEEQPQVVLLQIVTPAGKQVRLEVSGSVYFQIAT